MLLLFLLWAVALACVKMVLDTLKLATDSCLGKRSVSQNLRVKSEVSRSEPTIARFRLLELMDYVSYLVLGRRISGHFAFPTGYQWRVKNPILNRAKSLSLLVLKAGRVFLRYGFS